MGRPLAELPAARTVPVRTPATGPISRKVRIQGEQPGPPAPGQPQRRPPGQPAAPPASGQAPPPAAPGQPPAQPPDPAAPGRPPPAPEAAVLDWLPIGPVGRGDPIWYLRLKDRDCDKLEDVSGAMETACKPNLAALQDDAGDSPPISVCAGAAIVLVGTLGGLPVGSLRTVNVGTTTAQVRHRKSLEDNNYPFGEFFFLAPTPVPGEPTTVNVAFADADWSVEGSASFEYAADQSTCPPSPGSIP